MRLIYRLQGDRVDRILAQAGQKVTCSQGKLLVDGQPSPWLPLDPQQLPDGLDITVPENCYLILPSTDPSASGRVADCEHRASRADLGPCLLAQPAAVAVRAHPLNRTPLMARFDKLEFNTRKPPFARAERARSAVARRRLLDEQGRSSPAAAGFMRAH